MENTKQMESSKNKKDVNGKNKLPTLLNARSKKSRSTHTWSQSRMVTPPADSAHSTDDQIPLPRIPTRQWGHMEALASFIQTPDLGNLDSQNPEFQENDYSHSESDSAADEDLSQSPPEACVAGVGSTSHVESRDAVRTSRKYVKAANRDVLLSNGQRPIAIIQNGKLTSKTISGQNLIAGFFISNIRVETRTFCPRYKNLEQKWKDAIWDNLKAIVDMSEVDEKLARFYWEKRNKEKFRRFWNNAKHEALRIFEKTKVEELRSCPPLDWVPSEEMWRQIVDHWCSDEFVAKSVQGTNARMNTNGRDGQISKSGCGRIDITDKQLREEALTGKPVPLHKILSEVNRKRDKAGKLTDQVVDSATQAALEEAEERYKTYSDADLTSEYFPDDVFGKIYPDTEPVKQRGLKKGRILGLGSMDQALPLLKLTNPVTSSSSGAYDAALMEELSNLREVVRQHADQEAARQERERHQTDQEAARQDQERHLLEETRVMKEQLRQIGECMARFGFMSTAVTHFPTPTAQHQPQPSPWTQLPVQHQSQPSPWTQSPPMVQHHTQPYPQTQLPPF